MAVSPAVSIIIACHGAGRDHGAARDLERAIASGLAQTFPAIEVIAVFSGQGGVPWEPPPGITVYFASAAGSCWNLGANRASGRYLCFVLADDELERTCVEKAVFVLETCGFDYCGSFCGPWERDSGSSERTSSSWEANLGDLSAPAAANIRAGPLLATRPGGSIMARTGVIRASTLSDLGGFDERLPVESQVADVRDRISKRGGGVHFIPEVLIRGSRAVSDGKQHAVPDGKQHAGDSTLAHCSSRSLPHAPRFSCEDLIVDGNSPQPTILLAMPFLTVGGAEAVISRICKELRARRFRLVVITTMPAMESQGDATAWFEESAFGIYHLPKFLDAALWRPFLCYLIRQHSIGVLWQAGSSFTYDSLPLFRQIFPGLAIVDLLFNPVGHTANYLKYSYLIDHVVTEHAGMKDWLLQQGESEDNISIIPNGIDLSCYQPQPKLDWRTREIRPESDGRFVIGFIGRLSEEKGPDLFLEIAALLADQPGMEFVVYGRGPMEPALRLRAAESDLAGRVHLLGFASGREGHRCCDVVVVCSRLDGRPNVVMESLAMGIPVIASRIGGIPELMPDGDGGLLADVGDPAAFAAATKKLALDPQLHRRLSAAARARAERHFSVVESGRKFAELFAKVEQRRAALKRAVAPGVVAASAGLTSPRFKAPPKRAPATKLSMALLLLSPFRMGSNFKNAMLLWNIKRQGGFAPADGQLEHFDRDYYLRRYPDVARSRIPPLMHYVFAGFRESRDPSASFSTQSYLLCNPDVLRNGINPLLHYLLFGRGEGRPGGPPNVA